MNSLSLKRVSSLRLNGDCSQMSMAVEQEIPVFLLSNEVLKVPNKIHKINTENQLCFVASIYNTLYLAAEDGACFTFDVASNSLVEIGALDQGINSMVWSPDLELVAIVSNSNSLLLLSTEFDLINSVDLNQSIESQEEQIALGWGKKETQFHGSLGKGAASKSAPEFDNYLSPNDDLQSEICWRGDGNFFAVSIVVNNKRVIHVFNRDGFLQNKSEPVIQMEGPLSWRPVGNLIASSQRLVKGNGDYLGHDIILFEKNGLRHGEFRVDEGFSNCKNRIIRKLAWNSDSTILSVLMDRILDSGISMSCVLLYHMNNYHWYLTKELSFEDEFGSFNNISTILWDPEATMKFHLILSSGVYICHEFIFSILVSSSLSHNNPATVAVIDGDSILLTPFMHKNTPPPMSHHKLKLNSRVSSLSFFEFGKTYDKNGNPQHEEIGDDLVALDIKHSVSFFKSLEDGISTFAAPPKLISTVNLINELKIHLPLLKGGLIFRDVFVWKRQCFGVLVHDYLANSEFFLFFFTNDKELKLDQEIDVTRIERLDFGDQNICCLNFRIEDNTLFYQTVDLICWKLTISDENNQLIVSNPEYVAKLPTICDRLVSLKLNFENDVIEDVLIAQKNGKLFANNRVICSDVISFTIHPKFLVMTSLAHTARFISLEELESVEDIKIDDKVEDITKYDEHHRRIERGSRIVIACPSSNSLVFQLPRGNLETVYPRAFVLSSVRLLIDKSDYKTAFSICRKNRIDINFIFDHNPDQFLKVIKEESKSIFKIGEGGFISGLNNPDYINLFLSNLRNDDSTLTLYKPSKKTLNDRILNASAGKIAFDYEKKVDLVCLKLREGLLGVNAEAGNEEKWEKRKMKFRTSILTTFVKHTTPDLESALRMIKALRAQSIESAENSMKYVIFLVNVDKLYRSALGLYDFNLCLLVAQYSQMDPREYLPFLNSLKKFGKYELRFKVDDYLERREKALENLRSKYLESSKTDDDFVECLEYINRHLLYKHAIDIFRNDGDRFKNVAISYALYLSTVKSEFNDAAILFNMAEDFEKSLEMFKMAGLWKETMSLAFQLKFSEETIGTLCDELTEYLIDQRKYVDAAQLNEYYSDNVSTTISLFIKGGRFDDAIRIVYLKGTADLVESLVKPGILEIKNQLIEDLSTLSVTFKKQKERLIAVREEKAKKLLMMRNMQNDEVLNDIDIMSDTSSMATTRVTAYTGSSMSSSYTAKSSKQRRKQEKKRLLGKEGGAYEEEFLVKSLRGYVQKVDDMTDQVKNLTKFLLFYVFMDEARGIRDLFERVFGEVGELKGVILDIPLVAPLVSFERTEEVKEVVKVKQIRILPFF